MLDPRTGEILAMASNPYYDASAVTNPATAEETFEALLADPAEPLLPRATLGRYVPGSVFKIVTAIAGLGSGAVDAGDDVSRSSPAPRRTDSSSTASRSATATIRRPARAHWT